MPDFDDKPLLELVAQEREVQQTIIESEVAPALREEPELGPHPDIAPEIHHEPDPSALSAWMDDLSDFREETLGDPEAAELLDKIASGELDDLAGVNRGHLKDDVNADDEQQGLVPDFHADSALEGAALEPHKPSSDDVLPAAKKPVILEEGGGGGGGGGGGLPGGNGGDGEGEGGDGEAGDGEAAGDKPAKPKADEKGALGKLVGKVKNAFTSDKAGKPDKPDPAAKPAKPDKPDPKKPGK